MRRHGRRIRLIAALIAVAAVSVMTTVGHNLSTTFNTVATKL